MKIKILILWISLLFISSSSFGSSLSQTEIQQLLKTKISDIYLLAQLSLLVNAVRMQNDKNMSLEAIKQLNKEWTSTDELTPFKKSLQEGQAGKFLKRIIHRKKEVYNEVFLTDNQGANVLAYPVTSDYWQGDEAKWKEAFNAGKGKVYVGPVEFDESTGINAVQISVPVLDDGKTIGVLVMGLKLSYIESEKIKKSRYSKKSKQ
ncbi:PDC sensor domain-containing protein [Candidatus Halobeggiatoa sp. HSG11]|nr:PDC sensor domain-containing protein [Candidatus Halobeggiatoa sp. HSG11]